MSVLPLGWLLTLTDNAIDTTAVKRPHEEADSDQPLKRRLRPSTLSQAKNVPTVSKPISVVRSSAKAHLTAPLHQAPIPAAQDHVQIAAKPQQAKRITIVLVRHPKASTEDQPPTKVESHVDVEPLGEVQPQVRDQTQAQSPTGVEHVLVPAAEETAVTREQIPGEPKIWGKRRQGLCDALPYFKAHQGSLYTVDLLPLGFLIADEARARDHFDGQVIITSV